MNLAWIYGLFFKRDSKESAWLSSAYFCNSTLCASLEVWIHRAGQRGEFQSGMWQSLITSPARKKEEEEGEEEDTSGALHCCNIVLFFLKENCWLLYQSSILIQGWDLKSKLLPSRCRGNRPRLSTRGHPWLREPRRRFNAKARNLFQANNLTSTARHPSFEGDVHFLSSWAVEAHGAPPLTHSHGSDKKTRNKTLKSLRAV